MPLVQACGQFVRSKSEPETCVRCGFRLSEHTGGPSGAPRVRTMKGWRDTIRYDTCRSPRCRQPITFIQSAKSGKFMPFTGSPRPLSVEHELGTGRELWTLDLATEHHATCPGAGDFRRGGRR